MLKFAYHEINVHEERESKNAAVKAVIMDRMILFCLRKVCTLSVVTALDRDTFL